MSEDARDAVIRLIDEKYGGFIYKIAYGVLRDDNLVYDVKQQVLIGCLSRIELLSGLDTKQFTAYIATAAKNNAISEFHKRASYEALQAKMIEDCSRRLTMDHVDFKAFEDKYGFSEEMWSLLNRLPQMDRDLLVLKFHFRYSNPEIAAVFGTNVEQVKKRYQRVKKKLMKLIEKKGVELL